MQNALIDIQDLQVKVGEKTILDGVNLTIFPGELHVLMGPNGAGKSTLASSVMGDPRFTATRGRILFDGEDITGLSVDERARRGIFLSFQQPEEIPGITLENFLRTAKDAVTGKQQKITAFRRALTAQMNGLDMDPSYAARYLNVGFSGGEKKKAEILQLLMLEPKLALLDETDSGLDVDAVRTVAKGIRAFRNETNGLLIITHNAKILEGLTIDKVHVLAGHKIVQTGGPELVEKIIADGYASVAKE